MALTERYVVPNGAGAHNGTSEADAFSLAEAFTDANALAAGKRYNIKQGTYALLADLSLTGNATAAAPCVWRGYKTTIGDGEQGRSADGTLDQANMPNLSFGTNFEISVTGKYHRFQNLRIAAVSTATALTFGAAATGSGAEGCVLLNAGTGVSSSALALGETGTYAENCDISQTGASGGAAALTMAGSLVTANRCRIQSTSGPGVTATGGTPTISRSLIHGCGGDGVQFTATGVGAHTALLNSTIVDNAGDGVDFAAGFTALARVAGCVIAGNGGYGINTNAASLFPLFSNLGLVGNTSGAYSMDAEWEASIYRGLTLAASNFKNSGSDDYRLLAASLARDTTAMGQSLGASEAAGGGSGRRVIVIRGL